MELAQDSFVIGCSVSGCETSMLEELALGGERTVTLRTLFGVFLAAWRTGKKEKNVLLFLCKINVFHVFMQNKHFTARNKPKVIKTEIT